MRGFGIILTSTMLAACGGRETPAPPATPPPAGEAGLSAFQVEHGIGPVTTPMVLGPVDEELAEEGKEVFTEKCSACHKMGEKYVGPALGDVATRRSGAFIMNMILNPQEMVERHPAAKQLLAEHMTYMPNQGLTEEQARQVLEYLRTQGN